MQTLRGVLRAHRIVVWWATALAACLVVPCAAQVQPDPAAAMRQRKVILLQAAYQAAQQSGLDLLQEKAAALLAEASLQAGDLDAARAALIDIIARQESKRDQLAFDPTLRQQWFADNLGPYRKLMRVAALRNDPALALSCAERMRSRALIDQLAWRKTDMGVKLPKETQDRLQALRVMRKEA